MKDSVRTHDRQSAKARDDRCPVVMHVRVMAGVGGGPEKTILSSPEFLKAHGYTALCTYMCQLGTTGHQLLVRRAAEHGARLITISDRGPLDFLVLPKLLRICREHRVAIWHGHDYKSNALGLILRWFWPMRLVTTAHGWVQQTRRTSLYYAIDRCCMRRFDHVICVSPDLEESILNAGVRRDRCTLIDNAIDTDNTKRQKTSDEAKRSLGFRTDRLLVGAVGRLADEKAFDHLILAVAQLVDENLPVELAIIGTGEEEPRLRSLIAKLQKEQEIQLCGYRGDVLDLYEAMDVFALSSRREGLPNVLLEAMAKEVAVVTTSVGGVYRVIQHEQNGLLLNSNEPQALAAEIRRLVNDVALRHRLAAAGRRTIDESFSFTKRIEKLAAIYNRILNRNVSTNS